MLANKKNGANPFLQQGLMIPWKFLEEEEFKRWWIGVGFHSSLLEE